MSHQLRETIYTALIANLGGFATIHFLGVDFNVIDSFVKLVFGMISSAVFTIVGSYTKIWLDKRQFFKNYKSRK